MAVILEMKPTAAIPEVAPAIDSDPSRSLDITDTPQIRTKLRLYTILIAIYLVFFVAALDQTILATAIPTITASLHSAVGYTWIGSAYLLGKAVSGPIWVKCSDIRGRKPVLLGGVALFAVASIIAALSNTMTMLIAARALQGVAGSAIFQIVIIVISDLFSVRHRPLYISILGGFWVVAGTSGPLLGGVFTQYLTWRWCFWINLPICGIAFVLLLLFLDVHNPRTALRDGLQAVDWMGIVTMLAGTLLLLLGLNFGGASFPWSSSTTICLLVFGVAMIVVFVYTEKRLARYPLTPLAIFSHWSNNAVFLVAIAQNMVAVGQEYYLPLYFQSVKLASPLKSGILIIPLMMTEAIADILSGIIIHKTGRYREIIWVGTTLMTMGMGLFILFDLTTTLATIIGLEILAGFGTAILFQTQSIALQNSVTQADTASAIAALGSVGNFATAASVVFGGVVFQNSMAAYQHTFASSNATLADAFAPSRAAANVDLLKTLPDAHNVQEAFSKSIRNIFILYTGIAGVAVVASVFIKHKAMSSDHTETKTGIQNLSRSEKR